MDIARGGEAQSTDELGGEVADDVAEEVAGDNDVELAGVADQFHGEGVDEEVAGVDVGVFPADGFEDALPEISSEGHGVGLVGHTDAQRLGAGTGRLEAGATKRVAVGEFEGMPDDAFDAFAGVDVFLDGDLLGGSLLEMTAYADVEAFGVFAEDHQVEVFRAPITERGQAFVEEFGGAGVYVEVQLEAQAEEDVGGVLVGGHAGIAKSAKEDGVKLIAEHLQSAVGEGDLLAQVFIGAPVEFHKFQRTTSLAASSLDHLHTFGSDFLADAVAGNDRDAGLGAAVAERNIGHEGASGDGSEYGLR